MEQINPEIRNTAKAVCYNDNGAILMLKKVYEDGSFVFTLPGGSQEPGESIASALIRECEEEIAATVVPGQLHYICEYIKTSHTPGKPLRHKVEFGFKCTLPAGYTPQMGLKPDSHQAEVLWLSPDQLKTAACTPDSLTLCLEPHTLAPFIHSDAMITNP
ncbi:NUDIX domain-containing protein [Desulfobacter curvatus]|uniref:NUDIX domain-containing protein n=1 Tax=Desulfobacter curvatus TaxID=2290 RepID=UPI000374FB6D|nr:NUDIX domain-containing protein [Desulfobacter curvatus]